MLSRKREQNECQNKYGVTVYQLPDDKWYVRMKSSITAELIKQDPVFKAFRKSSGRMKEASPIASFIYKQLPVKHYPLYREITGKAILWLKEGLSAEVITERLLKEYLPSPKPRIKKLPVFAVFPKVVRIKRVRSGFAKVLSAADSG